MEIRKFISVLDKGLVVEVPKIHTIGVVIDFTIIPMEKEFYVKFTTVLKNRGLAICEYINGDWKTKEYNVKYLAAFVSNTFKA